ncbi:hypothetical protein PRUPE_7G026700 [Prunus persica]|uniref:Uncharacterized protein n=1 Tax=Prunus persica TaxID=3760 RepID=A0A251N5T5_PRUPE|nr:hypothetical protein PRUPE_7G026700 [Prunus persica]
MMAKFICYPSKCRIPMQEAKKNKCDAAKGKLRGTQRIVVENHKDINGLRKFTLKTKWKGIVAIEDDNKNRGKLRGHLRSVAKEIDSEIKFLKF